MTEWKKKKKKTTTNKQMTLKQIGTVSNIMMKPSNESFTELDIDWSPGYILGFISGIEYRQINHSKPPTAFRFLETLGIHK